MPTDDIDDLTDGQDSTGADGLALTGAELRDTFPSRRYHGQLHERFTLPAEPASHVPAREVLPADTAATLEVDPWSHQAEALEALSDGENVCVATSTSSGKTYVYGLHVARRFRENPDVRALLVYPTKALSRDQGGNSTISSIRSDWTSRSASTTATRNARRRPASARRRTSSSRILPD